MFNEEMAIEPAKQSLPSLSHQWAKHVTKVNQIMIQVLKLTIMG